MNDRVYQVIGVMPPSFVFRASNIDYWLPIAFSPEQAAARNSHFLSVVARLKPGVTLGAARDDMARVSRLLQQMYPDSNTPGRADAVVVPFKEDLLGDTTLEL